MTISKTFCFEAAHSLPHLPPDHKCHRVHGHSYIIEVYASGEVASNGFVAGLDYADLSRVVNERVIDRLDHRNLNDLMPLTTAEHLAVWIWNAVEPAIPSLSRVDVRETATTCVSYEGEQ